MRRLLCLSLLVCTFAQAEPRESLDYVYYDVRARPGEPLLGQVRAASPVAGGWLGRTDWHVSWRFRWNNEPSGACRFTSVEVELRSRITLPQLSGADARQSQAFAPFIAALRNHELGHHENGRRAAREIESALRSMGPAPGCAALESQANMTGQAILKRYNEMDKQYDRETEHGLRQGARL